MSDLLLVRHAQASFLQADYDRLSDHGREQARALGALWAQRGWRVDRLLAGPRRRQQDTALILRDALRAAGLFDGELEASSDLDEYPADEVLRARAAARAEVDDEFRGWMTSVAGTGDPRSRGRALDRMLQFALGAWAAGDSHPEDPESFDQFTARAARALSSCTDGGGSGRRVVAVSSAGTIGGIVGGVLRVAPRVTLELGWALHNSSVTELAFSPGRVGLVRFNDLAHLPRPETWTRR